MTNLPPLHSRAIHREVLNTIARYKQSHKLIDLPTLELTSLIMKSIESIDFNDLASQDSFETKYDNL